ncbi:patatin-like phospholipase family protein [Brevundimonas sp. SL130]|uniref:patatin-like phospholipase family protein n=1 Tax=Brevundimonas sp. SL130 TaxID=2995143 RepID=UPI00226C9C72|nr:patatin-like phospholipase family protein [Brevundimonas sp. SL130]WAC58426.1 patatin-like phospholipase family protein [Brevundimonas sp. SL130]
MRRICSSLLAVVMALSVASCGTLDRPVGPLRLADGALVPAQDPRIRANDAARLEALTEEVGARLSKAQPFSVLALSGGGANGAYGAGVLVGWTERGDRPVFDMVTGVSTGALAAPFAFAGSEWDAQLGQAYTGGGASNLLSWRSLAIFLYPSLFSAGALRKLVEDNVTPDLLQAIAREHAKGRRLLVATTNLDSEETVIWDMGLLASQNDDNSRALFKEVLVASASIPGVFPPVLIAGLQPDLTVVMEMHADGGINSPFLAIPENLSLWTRGPNQPGGGALYVVVNGQVGRNEGVTPGRLTAILMRSYDSMSKASLRTHLATTAAFAQRNGMSLSLAAIPDNVEASSLKFDQKTMSALFDLGRARGRSADGWTHLDLAPSTPAFIPASDLPADQIPEALKLKEPEAKTAALQP